MTLGASTGWALEGIQKRSIIKGIESRLELPNNGGSFNRIKNSGGIINVGHREVHSSCSAQGSWVLEAPAAPPLFRLCYSVAKLYLSSYEKSSKIVANGRRVLLEKIKYARHSIDDNPEGIASVLGLVQSAGGTLPVEAICPVCEFWDITDPEVIKVLSVRLEREPDIFLKAGCRCDQNEIAAKKAEEHRWQDANIPHPEAPRTIANFTSRTGTETALAAVSNFMQYGGPPILMLVGAPGSGKSHLLEAIARDAMGRNQLVRYDTAADFLERLRHTYSGPQYEDLSDLVDWYQSRSLVLLDDLGAEKSTDWAAEHLTSFIDKRMRDRRRMVIATNCTEADMAERLGERLRSRLYQQNSELEEVKRVTIQADDFRMEK